MANLNDIAKFCNVSVRTVTRALYHQGEISQETAAKIQAAAKELNYTPNYAARSLRLKKTFTIGLLRYSFDIEIQNKRIKVITEELDGFGYNILHGVYHDEHKARELVENFRQRCDGLILYCHPEVGSYDFLKPLKKAGFPHVLIDPPWETLVPFPAVYIDREAGIVQAVDHLIQIGRRNLSLMMMGTSSKVRIKGFKKALAKNNIPFHSGRIIDLRLRLAKLLTAREPLHTLPIESFMNVGYEEARNNTTLGATVDGLLSFDDKVSLGVLRGLAERGVRVPDQIALVGVDDDSYAAYTHVPLSTIRQPIHRVARKAVEMMMAQIRGETAQSITFPAEFIRRGTA